MPIKFSAAKISSASEIKDNHESGKAKKGKNMLNLPFDIDDITRIVKSDPRRGDEVTRCIREEGWINETQQQ